MAMVWGCLGGVWGWLGPVLTVLAWAALIAVGAYLLRSWWDPSGSLTGSDARAISRSAVCQRGTHAGRIQRDA